MGKETSERGRAAAAGVGEEMAAGVSEEERRQVGFCERVQGQWRGDRRTAKRGRSDADEKRKEHEFVFV